MVEKGVQGILGALLDGALLVSQRVQRAGDESLLLHHEDDLAEPGLGREALEDGAEGEHGALSLRAILLVGGSLDDLLDDAVAGQATETDAVEQDIGEGVGSVERLLGSLGGVDLVGDGCDVLGGGSSVLAGDHDLRGHGGRLLVWHVAWGVWCVVVFYGRENA